MPSKKKTETTQHTEENTAILKKYVDWMRENGVVNLRVGDIQIELQNPYYPFWWGTSGSSTVYHPTVNPTYIPFSPNTIEIK